MTLTELFAAIGLTLLIASHIVLVYYMGKPDLSWGQMIAALTVSIQEKPMTSVETRQTKARKDSPAPASTGIISARSLALDAGNYDLKFWDGTGNPKAIRSIRFQLPQGRDAVRYSDHSPLIELPDGTRYHFGTQAYKYRRQQQTVVENKIDLARLHLYACIESDKAAEDICQFSLNLHVSTPEPARNQDVLRAQLMGIHEFKRMVCRFGSR